MIIDTTQLRRNLADYYKPRIVSAREDGRKEGLHAYQTMYLRSLTMVAETEKMAQEFKSVVTDPASIE